MFVIIGEKIHMNYITKIKSCFRKIVNKTNHTIKECILSLISFIITFFVFFVVFKANNLYPFGEKSIAWCDLKQQGIPLLMNLKDVLSGDGSILYSFNNASGMNFWGVFLFFLSNPFSFLCVFFEKAELYKLVSTFVIIKLCIASFTSTLFFVKVCKNTSKGISVALGVAYSLCAYGLMYYQNIMWLDIMYLYPLLIFGIKKAMEKKGYALYTVILSLCVLFNFYLSFMVILSILLYIGLYLLISEDDLKLRKLVSFDLLKGSVIAALISSISWIPAFIQYSSSGRGESIFKTLSSSSWVPRLDTILLLLLSSSVIIIILLSFIKPTIEKLRIFLSFLLFFIPIFIEPINKMWHTGSYMSFPGRYAFITIFMGLYLVCLSLERKDRNKTIESFFPLYDDKSRLNERKNSFKKIIIPILPHIIFSVASAITVYILYKNVSMGVFINEKENLSNFIDTLWGNNKQLKTTFKVSLIFALVYFIYSVLYKLKLIPKRIFSIFLLCVIICEGIFAINVYVVPCSEKTIFNSYDSFLDLEGKIDDDEFYRIKTEKKYEDSNLLGALGYNSIGHYTSLTNKEYMNVSKALGYSSSWMELSTYGGTELSDAIMSVKYKVIRQKLENSVYSNETYSIVETFASLGLGVKYNGNNDVFSYDESSRTDFQEKIFASLFNSEEALFEKYTPTLYKNCSISTDGNKKTINGEGELIYYINVLDEQTLYFDAFGEFSNNLMQTINRGFDIYVNGIKISTYPDGMYTGFVNLGTFKDEKVTVKVITKRSHMSLISFGVSGLKKDVLKKAVENTESGFLNVKNNKAYGTVDGKDGEYLFVSIPYDEGFKVKVNGKKINPEKVFGDFYSIPLSNGVNNIEMNYTPPGFIIGIIFSSIGIVLFILFLCFDNNKSKVPTRKESSQNNSNKRKVNEENYIESSVLLNNIKTASLYLFIVLFIILVLVIYIFPILVKLFK